MQSKTVLRLAAVIRKTNLSKSTIYRLEAQGNFPQRVRLGANSTAWHADEVDAWLVNRPRVADASKTA